MFTCMLQSFGNDAGFILEISGINNGRDKNASVIYSEAVLSKPPQTVRSSSRIKSMRKLY